MLYLVVLDRAFQCYDFSNSSAVANSCVLELLFTRLNKWTVLFPRVCSNAPWVSVIMMSSPPDSVRKNVDETHIYNDWSRCYNFHRNIWLLFLLCVLLLQPKQTTTCCKDSTVQHVHLQQSDCVVMLVFLLFLILLLLLLLSLTDATYQDYYFTLAEL